MKTNAPRFGTWLLATLAGLLGILTHFGVVAALAPLAPFKIWLLIGGFGLLSLASILRGL